MRIIDCEQGSQQWVKARLGVCTASNFDRVLTPKTRKLSAGATSYRDELNAEWWFGQPWNPQASDFMQRGVGMEAEAAKYYHAATGVKPVQVGFIVRDDGMVGCSPDRLVGEDGLLEIKCLGAKEHVAALLGRADEYTCQVQGQMLVAQRDWCDRLYYHPRFPLIVRVNRDREFCNALADALRGFVTDLLADRETLKAMVAVPVVPVAPERPVDPFGDVPLADLAAGVGMTTEELDARIDALRL